MKLCPADLERAFRHGDFRYVVSQRGRLADLRPGESNVAAEWVAHALVALERWQEAIASFEALCSTEPDEPRHLVNLSSSLLADGAALRAYTLLDAALPRWPARQDVLLNFGIAAFAVGRYERSADALVCITKTEPQDDLARLFAVRALQEMGRAADARTLASHWFPVAESFSLRDQYELAQALINEDRTTEAEKILRFIRERYPEESLATLNLIGLYERANRIAECRELAASLPKTAMDEPLGQLVAAKLAVREQAMPQALSNLDRALAMPDEALRGLRAASFRSEVQFLRGTALDRMAQYDRAIEAFDEGNRLVRSLYTAFNVVGSEESGLPWLGDDLSLDAAVAKAGSSVDDTGHEQPIFLVGFPRSGTTLLDQVLDAHPALQVLEEKPALEAVVQAMHRAPGGYPRGLLTMGGAERSRLRRVYDDAVAAQITRLPGTRLVDKYPFNMVRLHLGMWLFPRARWILAVRHPADVVLSCYMQNFGFTDVTHGFWSIDRSAALYRQIMSLWLDQRERLAPDCLDVRYEQVVDSFEPQARRLLSFLGLEWDDRVLAYHLHARSRHIRTPSYSQVVQPIYRSSMERWRNYRSHMERALKILAPLITRLGYHVDDERGESAT